MFLFYEMLIFMAVLGLTFVFNQKKKYTLALIWFGSILNYHLIVLVRYFRMGGKSLLSDFLYRRRGHYVIQASCLIPDHTLGRCHSGLLLYRLFSFDGH